MTSTTVVGRVAVCVALVALVSGCAWRTSPVYVDVPAPTQPAYLTTGECPRDGGGLGGAPLAAVEGAIPPDFGAVTVLHCESQGQGADGAIRVTETTSGVTDQLLTALRLPDQELRTQGSPPVGCPAVQHALSLLMLVDDRDRAVVVRRPLGSCGDPRQEVVDAVRALTVDSVTTYSFDTGP